MADRSTAGGQAYWLRYLLVSAALLVVTWAVVTRVLPRRLVPNADFREQALWFSTDPPTFELPDRLVVSEIVPEPAPARPAADTAGGPRIGERGRLWRDVSPLLEAARWEEALPRLRSYLAEHPEDAAVRLELARSLVRAGRVEEAESEFRRLAADDDRGAVVGLAHLLWGQGRLRSAAEQFRRALELRPDDEEIRSVLARVLRTMGRYAEAARHYRTLIETSDRPRAYRVELARTLLWSGAPRTAFAELREVEGPEAAELSDRIAATLVLPSPDSAVADPLIRARRARAAGDVRRAAELYRLGSLLRPADSRVWLEWSDLLALDLQAPDRAVAVLEEFAGRQEDPPIAARRRMARYAAWSGQEERARTLLESLAGEGEASPRDLALLGDLRRWADERRRSDDAYRRALSAPAVDSATLRRAELGLQQLRTRDRQVVDERDPRRVGLVASRFDDSDGFGRTGVRAAAWLGTGSGLGRFVARADWARLEGARVAGTGTAAGAEVGYVRWMEHATARVEVRAGREQRGSGAGGTNRFSGDLLLLDRGVDRLGLAVSRRPAHEVTQSLASLRRGQTATGGGLRLTQAAGDATRIFVRARADLLSGGGASGGTVRLLGTGSWLRSAAEGLQLGVASRLLSYTSPAFTVDGRPGYWSPELSWTPSAVIDWRTYPGRTGWGLHARLQPGLSVVREHGSDDVLVGGSVNALGGALYRWDPATVEASVGWIRNRGGEYDALSATLGVTWRF